VHVAVEGGRAHHRLDGTYEDHGLVVEVDGHATHATRRRRQADAERDRHLVALGLRVIRYTYEDITERADLVRSEIARFLGIEVAA
jgi:very-short-patch-repair endonuclease